MMLLIYPPFAMPDKPYISLPTLAAELTARGIELTLWDANLSFFRGALDPRTLASHGQLEGEEIKDLFHDRDLKNSERMSLFGKYLRGIEWGEERLLLTGNTGYLRYDSRVSPFDSRALIEAARRAGSLTRKYCRSPLNRRIQESAPDLVGISVPFPDQILPALTLAAMIKEAHPDLPVALGGAFVTVHMKEIRNPTLFDLVDFMVLGDGEEALSDLHGAVKKGEKRPLKIPGVICPDESGRIQAAEPRVYPMAEARAPAYGLMPLDHYLVPRSRRAVLFRLSRGCYWAKCAFCNCLSPIICLHDAPGFEKTYENMVSTLSETRSPIVHFTDDAADPEMLSYLADRLIAEKRRINWTVNARVDRRLTLSLLSRLRQAGCFSLFIGVESCCDRVLRLMNKGTTLDRINRMVTDLSWAGISANIYMIVGFPTETESEARASFQQVCKWLDDDLVHQVVYNPFSMTPASPVAAAPEKFGITACAVPENKDLNPPISGFTCDAGMNRQQAAELCREFCVDLEKRRRH